MDFAISPNGYPNMYDRYGMDRYKKYKEHGFNIACFSQWNTDLWNYSLPVEESDKLLREETALAEAAGVKYVVSHGPWRVPWKDATVEDRKERMEKMKRSIHNAAVLGVKYWVVHPIMPVGIEEDDLPEAEITWKLNVEFMTELLAYAKQEDVVICLENMPMLKFSMARPEDIARFIAEMNDDHFQACLDTGHAHIFNDIAIGDAVRVLGNHIKVIHAHDNFYNKDLHLYPLHNGGTKWDELGEALHEVGFDGVIELEVNPPTGAPDFLYEQHARYINKIGGRLMKIMGYAE